MDEYSHKDIEKKQQDFWDKKKLYKAEDFSKKPKLFLLVEFPYPSGVGLHVGHCRSFTAMDIIARKKRMEGYNVLYPMGWDAFGLPTENYAIKTGKQPSLVTKENTETFKKQLKMIGFSFDWSREINTTDPSYYKWTQWIFLKLFENGLAYKKKMPINWCLDCKIGLANEEVVDGRCERCSGDVVKKEKEQWMLRITKYADRLIKDLDIVDFPQRVKNQQINWIGKSESTEIDFQIKGATRKITIITTRVDTIFGATFLVIAPEHKIIEELSDKIENYEEVKDYVSKSLQQTDFERGLLRKSKTGVKLNGIVAINPADKKVIPVYVSDFILVNYGTGAIMSVPAHDKRDFDFAKKFDLPIVDVIEKQNDNRRASIFLQIYDEDSSNTAESLRKIAEPREYMTPTIRLYEVDFKYKKEILSILIENKVGDKSDYDFISKSIGFTLEMSPVSISTLEVYTGDGKHINSGILNGLDTKKAINKMNNWLVEEKMGKSVSVYHLRDWVFSRQRYWGEPIPMINCDKCGWVPDYDLPVELPKVEKYEPTDTGESPLAKVDGFINVKCPKCKGEAKRETDVMPNWAGSNWYFIRYCDPSNKKEFASKKKLKYYMPVDWYNGGMEHTTLHLLYSRFIYKFLWDIKEIPNELPSEPYKKRTSHGMILAEGGVKMSKSKGNVINPEDVIKEYGADTLRLYEMFMGPFSQAIAWDTKGMKGSRRFLEKVWKLIEKKGETSIDLKKLLHKTIKKVTKDIDNMKFNTAVSSLMEFTNKWDSLSKEDMKDFLKILSPFCPHITEELWGRLGEKKSIFLEEWPKYDESLIKEDKVTVLFQVNGKVREKREVDIGLSEDELKKIANSSEKMKKWLSVEVVKVIFVQDKLINFVV